MAHTDKTDSPEHALKGIAIVAPAEVDRAAPPMASHVRIVGGTDAIILELFHLSSYRLGRAVAHGEMHEGMKMVDGAILEVESVPVARAGMSPTVAIETAVSLMESAFDQVASMQELGSDVQERFTQLGERMSGLGK